MGIFVPGTLCLETLCPWDVSSHGTFCFGTFIKHREGAILKKIIALTEATLRRIKCLSFLVTLSLYYVADNPPVRVFPLTGLEVDSRSSPTHLLIR